MDFLFGDILGKPLWSWLAFFCVILALLVFDLGILHRKPKEIGVRESLKLSAFYVGIGVAFAGWVWHHLGPDPAVQYLTGFVVEWSLALDNVFVIATIFAYFGIPRAYQHRVLVWGILGVVVLRAIMIGAGVAAVHEFDWVLQVFAAFLVLTGLKMLLTADKEYDVASNPILRLMRRRLRVTEQLHEDRFLVRQPDPRSGRVVTFATPLLLALVLVEIADIIFAVDSIPAIFAITTDPYIVYTSNIFAVLGLRALFFALSAMMHRFALLKYALAVVLVFIGGKILAADLLDIGKMPAMLSLAITLAILGAGLVASLWRTRATPAAVQSASGSERNRSAA
ncbi:MAG: TerC family protein [Alphaproteobacteria bacterium]